MKVKLILPALTEALRAIGHGIETATFHVLTPYPGTALHARIQAEGRILHRDWERYDTRHAVFRHPRLSGEALEAGYWRAYRDFYHWGSILRGAGMKPRLADRLRHLAYAGGWKKCEPLWDAVIRARRAGGLLPALEAILAGFGLYAPSGTDSNADAHGSVPLAASLGLQE